jgi:hypothetical protein
MATEIEDDASTILRFAVEAEARAREVDVDQVDEHLSGPELQQGTGLPPHRINDAVALLEQSGYVQVFRAFGTAEFNFSDVFVTSLGRFAYQRAMREEAFDEESEERLPRLPIPVGSPYGFTDHDWEYVDTQRRQRDRLRVVLGYQFESDVYDAAQLVENVERRFTRAVDAYNDRPGRQKIDLTFGPPKAGYGEHLFNEIARDIISSDIAVFETSDFNPNVMIEMGIALTWGVRVLPIKVDGQGRPPSDISGQTWADYRDSGASFADPDHEAKLESMVERAIRKKAAD